jgi:DHA1 family bicyclomycin/chloramphenicol resistance-like MFS transporter
MYLPAIPMLQKQWGLPFSTVNLSVVLFFMAFSLFLLIYGPLSDRYGRRPILLLGIGLFVLASLLCARATGIAPLVISRVLQAAGAASASAISWAICRDVFAGRERQQVLAYIGVIVAFAPMLSPIIGGAVLLWLSWPWIFIVQGTLGMIAMIGVYRMQETLPEPSLLNPAKLFQRYIQLIRHFRYMSSNLAAALSVCPMFAFIGGASDIYITRFGISEQIFGFFLAFNALALMGGFFACARLVRHLTDRTLISVGYWGTFAGGLWLWVSGGNGPWRLAVPMSCISFCIGLSRPLSNNLVLEQISQHVGAAASLMVFTYFILGSLAMWLISQAWDDKIRVLALFTMGAGAATLGIWHLMQRVQAPEASASTRMP